MKNLIITSVGSESWTRVLELELSKFVDTEKVDIVICPFYNRAHESANILAGKEKYVHSLSGYRFEMVHENAMQEFLDIKEIHSTKKWGEMFLEDVSIIQGLLSGSPVIVIVNDIAHKEEHDLLKDEGAISVQIGDFGLKSDYIAFGNENQYSTIANDFINNYLSSKIKNLLS